jgi:putative acetyltransferase
VKAQLTTPIPVEIVSYAPEWAADFARLNYEWIEKYFSVEPHDRDILDDPQTWVIDPGGEIFMAVAGGEAVGTVALIPAEHGVLELTKMAVSPRHHGRGVANKLMTAAIDHARGMGLQSIFLETHHKLTPALNLYRKHGFVDVPTDPNSMYSRSDIRMVLAIPNNSG